ncbi:MAG: hypothetical protein A3D95_02685 [Betaproteobacteria bacterium RIFCSPHIGHO2_12_FULL_69_13]|nr:MAG: hypothetical protein A3D95_02685 [Betaproteobacteria bacterium RIFCSPHIGHO2_12_FULL_69_13]OGA67930.1 MAG: hypothetical protein A3G83_06530 [Betaproteobacteria bacterium RIFCSPLOWO2_12_FULL_68_20]
MNAAERQKPPAGELFLDHVAHFVEDLGAAAKLLESLGFVVTPESAHHNQDGPAGTSNRCVMFEEGYVEILAPTLDTENARRVRADMARYAGVHLACFGTPTAEFEHTRLADHGFEPPPLVRLERELDVNGETREARFDVVYVPPENMPEGRIQYVEQLTPENIWQPRYLGHTNGMLGLSAVFVVADDPVTVAARWARFSGLLPFPEGNLVRLDVARGRVLVGTSQSIADLLGGSPAAPALAGYALKCGDPKAFADRCARAGLGVTQSADRHSVALPPSLGGVWLLER